MRNKAEMMSVEQKVCFYEITTCSGDITGSHRAVRYMLRWSPVVMIRLQREAITYRFLQTDAYILVPLLSSKHASSNTNQIPAQLLPSVSKMQ